MVEVCVCVCVCVCTGCTVCSGCVEGEGVLSMVLATTEPSVHRDTLSAS